MFNSKEYEFSDVSTVVAGRDITGLRGVKYTEKQEKEALYAKGNKPHSIQHGNKSVEGSITLLQSELEAMVKAGGGSALDIAFNIVVVYGNPSNGDALITDIIKHAEFTEVPKQLKQGDKFQEIELPFIALDVKPQAI